MKYVSLDIETTGLDAESHQVLAVCMVLDDLTKPDRKAEERTQVCFYVLHEYLHGSPVALDMNAEIVSHLANGTAPNGVEMIHPADLIDRMRDFLTECGYFTASTYPVFAGKNVAGFDLPFLKAHAKRCGQPMFRYHHRTLDPGPMYVLPDDDLPPSLNTCTNRAVQSSTSAPGPVFTYPYNSPDGFHDPQWDAHLVVNLIRHALTRKAPR